MASISLCMIVKNEEQTLERCLNSAKNFVDEIIVVDTGSTDGTVQIAKNFGCKVFYFEWCDNFAAARNFAFSKAKCNYILWLDADDVVPKQTANFLKRFKNNLTADCYMLKYNIAFVNNKPTFSYYRERIVKNCKNAVWQGRVHECIAPFGKVEHLNYAIEHRKIKFTQNSRNLKIYKQIKKERQLSPREQYYYARELYDHKKYKAAICQFNKFINSNLGWTENIIDALYLLADCYFQIGNWQQHMLSLFKTFNYDAPRANVCCKVGDYFLVNQNFDVAEYWYMQATKCKDVTQKGGFVQNMFYNYYPYLQLCVCSYKKGDINKAIYYNNLADKFYPNSYATKQNKLFF